MMPAQNNNWKKLFFSPLIIMVWMVWMWLIFSFTDLRNLSETLCAVCQFGDCWLSILKWQSNHKVLSAGLRGTMKPPEQTTVLLWNSFTQIQEVRWKMNVAAQIIICSSFLCFGLSSSLKSQHYQNGLLGKVMQIFTSKFIKMLCRTFVWIFFFSSECNNSI